MTVSRRLGAIEKVDRGRPRPDDPTLSAEDLIYAYRNHLWSLADWRIALGESQIDRFVKHVMAEAIVARRDREAGKPAVLGLSTGVAAEIVSYKPDEVLPDGLAVIINRRLKAEHIPSLVMHLIDAALAAIVLHTTDGLWLRRRLWEGPQPPDKEGHPRTSTDI